MSETFETLTYETRDRKAYLTLNRPDRLNAITHQMARDIRNSVEAANDDLDVHVIVLHGAGKAFCAGYDLEAYAEEGESFQPPVWDPIKDFKMMEGNTDDFFSLGRSLKPTIAKVQGYAVAEGSDIALSCDVVIMADDAKIGYILARVWGCPTTAMWVYKLGAERAKRMLLTATRSMALKSPIGAWCSRLPMPPNSTRPSKLWPTGWQECQSTKRPDLMGLAEEERIDLLNLLRGLTVSQWELPSLCTVWRVRDVAVHIVSYDEFSTRDLVATFLRGGPWVARVNKVALRRYADLETRAIIDLVARRLRARGPTAGFKGGIALTDGTIHQQDIRRAIDRPRTVSPERLTHVLSFTLTAPTLPAKKDVAVQ